MINFLLTTIFLAFPLTLMGQTKDKRNEVKNISELKKMCLKQIKRENGKNVLGEIKFKCEVRDRVLTMEDSPPRLHSERTVNSSLEGESIYMKEYSRRFAIESNAWDFFHRKVKVVDVISSFTLKMSCVDIAKVDHNDTSSFCYEKFNESRNIAGLSQRNEEVGTFPFVLSRFFPEERRQR